MLGMDEEYKHESNQEDLLMLLAMLMQLEKQLELDINQFDYQVNEYTMKVDKSEPPNEDAWEDDDGDEKSRYARISFERTEKTPAATVQSNQLHKQMYKSSRINITYYTTCYQMNVDIRHEETGYDRVHHDMRYNLWQSDKIHLEIRKRFLRIFKAVQHYRRVTVPIRERQNALDAISKCFPQIAVETLFLREQYVKDKDNEDGDDRGVSSEGREGDSPSTAGKT